MSLMTESVGKNSNAQFTEQLGSDKKSRKKGLRSIVEEVAVDALDGMKEVPFRPKIDKKIVAELIANFEPEPERVHVRVDKLDERRQDNPRDVFDNRPSSIPWDDTGRFNSPKEMQALINGSSMSDPMWIRAMALPATLFSLGGYIAVKRKAVKEGTFRVLNKGLSKEVRLPGHHTAWSPKSKWGEIHSLDNEDQNIIRLGNKTILRIRANNIGVAFLVGDKVLTNKSGKPILSEDGNEQLFGRDGDVVLFSQGSYVLNESEYRDIHTGEIDENESIIKVGSVTILNIAPGYVGGALHRGSNQYRIFQTGAPMIFDNKEWCEYAVVERTKNNFDVGPIKFMTLSAHEVACVGRKDGTHLLLTEENTYQFHTREWESFEKLPNGDSLDLGSYYVRTVGKDQVGSVRNLHTGEFQELKPGKYYIYMKDYSQPEIKKLDEAIVRCGPWSYLRVQNDFYTGARNVQTGEFVEFDKPGKLIQLHDKEYPKIERIKRVAFQPQSFGPFTVITVAGGMYGVFEEQGKIRIAEPGTYKLDHGCEILEPLPSCPQQFHFEVNFLSNDGFHMSVNANIHFELTDAVITARKLRSDEITYVDFKRKLEQRCLDSLVKLLKKQSRSSLYQQNEEKSDLDICAQIAKSSCDDLNSFSAISGNGVKFRLVELTGGFKLVDQDVVDNFAKLAKSEIAAKANEAQAKANKAAAKAEAVREVEKAQMAKEVKLLQEQTTLEAQEMALKTQKMQEDQRLSLIVEEENAQDKIRRMKMQYTKDEEQAKADAAAYEVRTVAEANFMRAQKENEVAEKRPESLVRLDEMRLVVEGIEKYGQAAWKHPQPMSKLMKALVGSGSNSTQSSMMAACLLSNHKGDESEEK